MGLTEEFVDIKDASKDPTIKYVKHPDVNCRSLLLATRKRDNFNELRQHEATYGEHMMGAERLQEREDCVLRLGHASTRNRVLQCFW